MRVKNVIITIIMLSFVGYGGLKLFMWQQAKEDIDKVFLGLSLAMSELYGFKVIANYKQISTSILGAVGIKGVSLRFPSLGEEITIAEFKLLERDLDGDSPQGGLPLRLHFLIDDLNMNISLLEKLENKHRQLQRQSNIKDDPNALLNRLGYKKIVQRTNDLRALGYDKTSIDMEFDIIFDPVIKEATVIFNQDIKDFARIDIMIKVVELENSTRNAVLGVRIKEARLKFVDHSYMNRVLKLYAEDEHVELEDFRKRLILGIKQDINNKKIILSENSIKNIQTFVKKPEKIIFTVYPYNPVAIESFKHYKAGDVPSLLNLQVHLE